MTRQQTAKQRLEIETEISDLQAIMQSRSGRRFMWGLLSKCGVFQTSFTGNSTTFFNEGRRDIGLQYIKDLNLHCLDEYQQMVREANEGKR